ncbi:MAG: hypothetical protein ABEJ62_00500 [Candidatus Nanohaloarchaea archaeon]
MEKRLLLVSAVFLFFSAASGLQGEAGPVSVDTEVAGESYTFFPGQGVVQAPSVTSGGNLTGHRNVSLREFAVERVENSGINAVRQRLNQQLAGTEELRGITFSVSRTGIEVKYLEGREQGFTFSELVSATPSKVRGTIRVDGGSRTVSVPVNVERADGNTDPGVPAQQSGSTVKNFTSRTGDSYNESFRVMERLEPQESHIENISTGENTVSLTGYIMMPSSCYSIERDYIEIKDGLVARLKPTLPESTVNCTGSNVTLKYRLRLDSDSPFRLMVRQRGIQLAVVETSNNSGLDGILERVLDFLRSLV